MAMRNPGGNTSKTGQKTGSIQELIYCPQRQICRGAVAMYLARLPSR